MGSTGVGVAAGAPASAIAANRTTASIPCITDLFIEPEGKAYFNQPDAASHHHLGR
jgi:hypothetical protein